MYSRTSTSRLSAIGRAAMVLGLLCGAANAIDPQYFPKNCAKICKGPEDFATPLPPGPTGKGNRPSEWSIVTLNQIKANLGTTSPPGVGRALAIVSMCMYEAVSLFESENLEPWAAKDFEKIDDNEYMDDVIDGAAFTALEYLFEDFDSFESVPESLKEINKAKDTKSLLSRARTLAAKGLAKAQAKVGFKLLNTKIALATGAIACDEVIEKFAEDGFDGLARPLPDTEVEEFEPINDPQSISGVTDCEKEMKNLDRWQPLCTPKEKKPLADVGNPDCKVQSWLAPWAGGMTSFALLKGTPKDGKKIVSKVAAVDKTILGGPPSVNVGLEWQKQMMEVVEASAKLDDVFKLVAEHWADGPDSTAPPGTWFLIANDAAKAEGLDTVETAKLLMLVGAALNDAGVASWRLKSTYDSIRPLQMVQCGFIGSSIRKVDAWRGPYMGVGPTRVDEWQPFQLDTFKTPPFAGYVSGHSTFSSAAAEVLKLYFGSDKYLGPQCAKFEEGGSSFERKITSLEEGFIKGLTDVPNKGRKTVGYSPASDVTICWETFSDAAAQAGESRVYGGIHVKADDVDGAGVGKQVARSVFVKGNALFGEKTKIKAVL
ncbi:hypothetical protein BSKO_09093 [Bryopsis sp. KO-2023]|nr:hypothetical protein BSKO_09093 [Bryopsis sp. KO-2023]